MLFLFLVVIQSSYATLDYTRVEFLKKKLNMVFLLAIYG